MSRRPAIQCSATAKGTGEQCRRFAIVGGRVCPMHGGAAGHVRLAADRRVQVARVEQAAAKYATPRDDVTPSVALVEELRRAAGLVAWLEERVRSSDAPLTGPEFDRLGQERDRLTRLASDLARLGIEQTMIEATRAEDAKRQATVFVQVLRHTSAVILDALGVPAGDDVGVALQDDLPFWAYETVLRALADKHPILADAFDGDAPEKPERLATALASWRESAEKPLRDTIASLEMQLAQRREDIEALRSRVQSDGMATRLALPAAGGWEPGPVDVAEDVAAAVLSEPAATVLEGGEVIEPQEPPARGQRVSEHFAEARRAAGYTRPARW